ncbi:hypothetical protein KFK09_027199 [Dendrobium nobile]|uniref:Uncharacterized protein n=1 Tax=Dendrobium nobile TaxID=94219 RepID=A0A8T3AA13_DENNO|nr:hypothetical protein KFK09_027199 [Dendrobium nobile]
MVKLSFSLSFALVWVKGFFSTLLLRLIPVWALLKSLAIQLQHFHHQLNTHFSTINDRLQKIEQEIDYKMKFWRRKANPLFLLTQMPKSKFHLNTLKTKKQRALLLISTFAQVNTHSAVTVIVALKVRVMAACCDDKLCPTTGYRFVCPSLGRAKVGYTTAWVGSTFTWQKIWRDRLQAIINHVNVWEGALRPLS